MIESKGNTLKLFLVMEYRILVLKYILDSIFVFWILKTDLRHIKNLFKTN